MPWAALVYVGIITELMKIPCQTCGGLLAYSPETMDIYCPGCQDGGGKRRPRPPGPLGIPPEVRKIFDKTPVETKEKVS